MQVDDDLIARNDAWVAAIRERDVSAAEGLLADDYALVLVVPEKRVVPRAEWLAMLPGYVVDGWTVEEQVVDERDDLAAVLQRVRMKATVYGVNRSGTFLISDVWTRQRGEWRVWRRHSSALEAGALPRPSV